MGDFNERPQFCDIKSYDEFARYYWYREELTEICKSLGLAHDVSKRELNLNIKAWFEGKAVTKKKAAAAKNVRAISLDCPLLLCGFSMGEKFRSFFKEATGVENFKFTANMASAWRKVKEDRDMSFTVGDMLDVYYGKNQYAVYDNSSCQWNKFLKDFCADESNSIFKQKLKAASVIWGIVRNSTDEKVYRHGLVEENLDKVKEFL